MSATFHASKVAAEDMEDFWLVGFANREKAPREYLLLQRAYEFDEHDRRLGMATYYVERNDQKQSQYGGIESFVLQRDQVTVTFDAPTTSRFRGEEQLRITFQLDDVAYQELRDRLEKIFADEKCFRTLSA